MGYSVEGLRKIKNCHVHLFVVLKRSYEVMDSCQQLGLTGIARAKSMV